MYISFRNINTVRSVIRLHGDKVDRYYMMASVATRGAYKVRDMNFLHFCLGWLSKIRLDLKLRYVLLNCLKKGIFLII